MISLATARLTSVMGRPLLFKNSIAGFISDVFSYPIFSRWETKSQIRSKVKDLSAVGAVGADIGLIDDWLMIDWLRVGSSETK